MPGIELANSQQISTVTHQAKAGCTEWNQAGKRQMHKMKLVMVGNGMAGVRTLEELLKLAPDLYEITVFGAEPHPNYNRILLSPVLAGEQTLSEIVLNPREWYVENGIDLRTGTKVTRIDRARRGV